MKVVMCVKCQSVLSFSVRWYLHLSTNKIYCGSCAPAGCKVFEVLK